MRRNIRVKEFHTPCAGTRPGAADPTAQQSCVPATAPRTKVTKLLTLEIGEESGSSAREPRRGSESGRRAQAEVGNRPETPGVGRPGGGSLAGAGFLAP